MNFPLLNQFYVKDNILKFFEDKLEQYKNNSYYWVDIKTTCTKNGIQTKNLLTINDEELLSNLDELRRYLEKKFEFKLKYYWVHMIEYEYGGKQDIHNHEKKEDFSVILYLNDCVDGNTCFILSNIRKVMVSITPQKNKGVIFSSLIKHYAEKCSNNKKVLVCGFRLY